MKRGPCIAGQATNLLEAYREGDYSRTPFVIKDSWQYPEREEGGELLRSSMGVERMLTSELAGGDRVGGCVCRDGRGN
jgi:hypothetical protein